MDTNYYTGFTAAIGLSTLITGMGIPFAYVDLLTAYVYPQPYNLLILLTAKTLGSTLCFVVARSLLSEE